MDGIAIGCLAAMAASRFRLSDAANRWLLACGTLLALLITVFRGIAERIGFYKVGLDDTVLEIGIALVLIALQQRFESRNTRVADRGAAASEAGANSAGTGWLTIGRAPGRVLRWFGRDSYEVYLTHMFVVFALFAIFVKYGSPIWSVPLLFVVTVVVAAAAGDIVARFFSEIGRASCRERV